MRKFQKDIDICKFFLYNIGVEKNSGRASSYEGGYVYESFIVGGRKKRRQKRRRR